LYAEIERPLFVGELDAVCLPPAVAQFGVERGYVEHGACADGVQPVLKRIAAVAGDIVDVQPDGDTITMQQTHPVPHRVRNSAVLTHDRQGRPLPHVPWGPYTLRHGELWLLSTRKANSWDSRYFGPVSVFDVLATMCPVLAIGAEGSGS
jgi:conjugative transfer signal peptidase TraF